MYNALLGRAKVRTNDVASKYKLRQFRQTKKKNQTFYKKKYKSIFFLTKIQGIFPLSLANLALCNKLQFFTAVKMIIIR